MIPLWYAGLFFVAAFTFLALAVRRRKEEDSILAFWYSVVFEFAGFASLVAYRLTSG
jgi:hypothetical protein